MNYSEPLINQVVVFFRSVGAGIILGIIYSVINIIRAVFGERKSVYVFFDLAFFIIASFISFFFMVLYNSGQVRFNLMLGEAAGALSFYYSLGIYIVRTAKKYTDAVKKSVAVIISPVVKLLKKSGGFLRNKFFPEVKAENKNCKTKEKISLKEKIHLKNKNKSV